MTPPGARMKPARGPDRPLVSLVQTAAFYPLMAAWVAVSFLFAPPLLLLARAMTGTPAERAARRLVKLHGRGVMAILSPFVRLTRERLDSIPCPCILVVNHLSFFDGYYMAALPFYDLTFAVGSWPFRMVWYTAVMRTARYLDVDRMPWADALAACRRASAGGGTVLFFPEGHRSRTGEMLPFRSGAFRMATETGLPLVPLCIAGTETLLPPGAVRLHPARVRLRALPAFDPAGYGGTGGAARLRKDVREAMSAALREMEPGGGAPEQIRKETAS